MCRKVLVFMLSMMTLSGLLGVQPASADLAESQVLLIYNSQVAESLAIRNAYVATHSGVLEYDLNLAYPILSPGDPQSSSPPPEGINNQFVTPARFEQIFYDKSPANTPLEIFLDAHPEILAIATTRGLPAAVSTDFDPRPQTSDITAPHCSLEAKLAARGFGTEMWPAPGHDGARNPYYEQKCAFEDFIHMCGGTGPAEAAPGDMYLVTRLDSGVPDTDVDGDNDIDHLDGVLALIARSQNLTVVKQSVNSVFDEWDHAELDGWLDKKVMETAAGRMWDDLWWVAHETTCLFVHGPTDTPGGGPGDGYDPATDGPFNSHPILTLCTYGVNHTDFYYQSSWHMVDCEYMEHDYTVHYNAHAAGLFLSYESGNGWALHSPGEYAWGQGQILGWIGGSGGSFAIGNIQEPHATGNHHVPDVHYIAPNLYINGLTWAEAAYSGLQWVGQYQTPVGDPLAQVVVYDADVDADHDVDQDDVLLVISQQLDINLDGVYSLDDPEIVLSVLGRACPTSGVDPAPDWPTTGRFSCGNCVQDCYIDMADLAELLSHLGEFCYDCDCDGDGWVTNDDLNILLDYYGWMYGDCNLDGIVNADDTDYLLTHLGKTRDDPEYDLYCDLNADRKIDYTDIVIQLSAIFYCG